MKFTALRTALTAPLLATSLLATALLASPASAQFSDSYNFLKAVRDRDGTKATEILSKPGSVLVDTRDIGTQETALHIVTKGRDLQWMNFILARDAKADVRDKDGLTPLIIATRMRFAEGATALLKGGASVDFANNAGETPLIIAVQMRDPTMTRLLLNNGANPDRKDRVAGQSARDYAKSDPRAGAILKIIEEPRSKPKAASTMGPKP